MVPPDPVWVGSVTVRAGDFHVGVRTDDDVVLDLVRSAYEEVLVEDGSAAADYAVSTKGGPPGISPRLLPYVAHGRCPLLRSRDRSRLLRRLDLELGRLVGQPVPGSVAVYGMAALVAGDRAALVPTAVAERSTGVEEHLRTRGIGIVEESGFRLDPVRAEIVVAPGLLGHVPPVFDDSLAVGPGRRSVRGLFWRADELARDERPAVALVRLLSRLEGPIELGRGEMLRGLARMEPSFSTQSLDRSGVADLGPVVDLLC